MEEKSKSLKDIKILNNYSSGENDLIKEFYVPVLSKAIKYSRITGFFSSDSFAAAAKGMGNLIRNNGKIKLIIGAFVRNEDIAAAKKAIIEPQEVIKEVEKILDNFDRIEDLFTKEAIKAFSWMLANNSLELKIATPKINLETEFSAIFHQKIGIIEDSFGDKISFSGSINETGAGWLKNIEEFKVFKSWELDEYPYFYADEERFARLWNDNIPQVSVLQLSSDIKEKFIRLSPSSLEDIDFDVLDGKIKFDETVNIPLQKGIISLRDYQKLAIEKWHENNNQGIIEMATGTGKTYVGVAAINWFFERENNGVIIILAPTHEILSQWNEDIDTFIIHDKLIDIPKNKKILEPSIHDYLKNRLKKLIILSSYDSFKNIVQILKDSNINEKLFLIADEVHSLGALSRSSLLSDKYLQDNFHFKLGLSATPDRLYDEKGSTIIKNYFGGIIYKFTIGDAIKKDILCPYNYYITLVNMTKSELSKYRELTKRYSRSLYMEHNKILDDNKIDNSSLTRLLIRRAAILKKLEEKNDYVENILYALKKDKNIKYTIIFCFDHKQIDGLKKILSKLNIIYSQITDKDKEYLFL